MFYWWKISNTFFDISHQSFYFLLLCELYVFVVLNYSDRIKVISYLLEVWLQHFCYTMQDNLYGNFSSFHHRHFHIIEQQHCSLSWQWWYHIVLFFLQYRFVCCQLVTNKVRLLCPANSSCKLRYLSNRGQHRPQSCCSGFNWKWGKGETGRSQLHTEIQSKKKENSI